MLTPERDGPHHAGGAVSSHLNCSDWSCPVRLAETGRHKTGPVGAMGWTGIASGGTSLDTARPAQAYVCTVRAP